MIKSIEKRQYLEAFLSGDTEFKAEMEDSYPDQEFRVFREDIEDKTW